MPPITDMARAVSAAIAAVLATAAFVLLRDADERWASTLPGALLGLLGVALMLWAAFGYAWRKRRVTIGAPPMRNAMRAHVIAGLLGPYLVILHSGLAFRGIAGVAALLMVLVVASGVVGLALVGTVPRRIDLSDPRRDALLDAEIAGIERDIAVASRRGLSDEPTLIAMKRAATDIRHEQSLLRTRWRQGAPASTWRRVTGWWWLLHVPVSFALWVLAAVHIGGALFYATFTR